MTKQHKQDCCCRTQRLVKLQCASLTPSPAALAIGGGIRVRAGQNTTFKPPISTDGVISHGIPNCVWCRGDDDSVCLDHRSLRAVRVIALRQIDTIVPLLELWGVAV